MILTNSLAEMLQSRLSESVHMDEDRQVSLNPDELECRNLAVEIVRTQIKLGGRGGSRNRCTRKLCLAPSALYIAAGGIRPHPIPPLLFSNLLIYKTNTLSACQGAMARFARP